MDNNNWPDPARPGVPLNPERDGWHWLEWMDYCGTKPTGMIDQFKWERDGYWDRTTHRSARYWACWRYIGPCLTPAEAVALQAENARLRPESRKLRRLVRDLLENDPDDMAADAVTVLDVWRKEARAALGEKE